MPKHGRRAPDVGNERYLGVIAFDIGHTNTSHCALGARVKPNGRIRIEPLSLETYAVGRDAAERPAAIVARLRQERALLDRIHDFSVEQQVPVLPPEAQLRRMAPGAAHGVRHSHAANVVAYGIGQALIGSLQQAYPERLVHSVSPQHKFGVLGLHRPSSKPRRKTRATHFFHAWLMHHAHKKRWQPFVQRFTTRADGALRTKRDDPADAFCAALARLFEILAQNIDLRRVRGGLGALRAGAPQ